MVHRVTGGGAMPTFLAKKRRNTNKSKKIGNLTANQKGASRPPNDTYGSRSYGFRGEYC